MKKYVLLDETGRVIGISDINYPQPDWELVELPDDFDVLNCENYKVICGMPVYDKPISVEPTPAELREQAYNTEPCVPWDGAMLTVTEAAQRWAYYAAEGRTDKTDALTVLIAEAKAAIREKYPDEEGGT